MSKVKGEANGLCNRGACQTPHDVVFYHRLNHNYYCRMCAGMINRSNMDYDNKPLCYYDVEADIVEHMNMCKEYRDPAKYQGDEHNREVSQEHIFSFIENRSHLFIRGLQTTDRYLKMTNHTIRSGDLVLDNNDSLPDEVTVNGEIIPFIPTRDYYPTPEIIKGQEISRLKRNPKDFAVHIGMDSEHFHKQSMISDLILNRSKQSNSDIVAFTPPRGRTKPSKIQHTHHRAAHEATKHIAYGMSSQVVISDEYNNFDFSAIEQRVLSTLEPEMMSKGFPCQDLSDETIKKLNKQLNTNNPFYDGSSVTIKGHNGKIIAKEVDMPEDYGSKLDYKARFKRVGDMVRDTVTGKLIPVRKCPQDIKRALGIR